MTRRWLWLIAVSRWLKRLATRLERSTYPRWFLGTGGLMLYGKPFGEKTEKWSTIIKRDPCAYCYMNSTTVDHVIPKSIGGAIGAQNTVGACRKCNAEKGTIGVIQFLMSRNDPQWRLANMQAARIKRRLGAQRGPLQSTIAERLLHQIRRRA